MKSIMGQNRTRLPQSWQLLSASTMSFVTWQLGIYFPYLLRIRVSSDPRPGWDSLTENTQQTLRRIVMDCTADDCTCSCSVSGCTARTLIARSYLSRVVKRSEEVKHKRTSFFRDIINPIVQLIDVDAALGCSETLRLLTFEGLGLTHTCCYPQWVSESSFMFYRIEDQAEINEIREEQSAGLSQLEELLTELESKFDELEIPLLDFLTDYWEPRMEGFLDEDDGSLDMEAIREIGVEMDEPCLESESVADENLNQVLESDTGVEEAYNIHHDAEFEYDQSDST